MRNIHWQKVVNLKKQGFSVSIIETASSFVLKDPSSEDNDALINWSSTDAQEAQSWLKKASKAIKK